MPPRRLHSPEFKLTVVEEAIAPGASVSAVARRHDINTNMVFRWRRQYRSGELGSLLAAQDAGAAEGDFIAVGIVDESGAMRLLPPPVKSSGDAGPQTARETPVGRTPGLIEIILRGGVRVRVDPGVDEKALRRVLLVVRELASMIQVAPGTRVYLACRPTDMRKGFDGLTAQVSNILRADPYSGHLFVFRGKRGDYVKILYWDGSGLCLFAKRLEQGTFVWPPIIDDSLHLTPAQLALLIEGIDWRRTVPIEAPRIPVCA